MRVLLIVDMQRDFCPGGSLAVADGDKIVPVINRLLESNEFVLKVASRDWHPLNHMSYAIWAVHCVQNSDGAKFHNDLKINLIDSIIDKGTDLEVDSYSAFFDNEKKKETGLRALLEKFIADNGIDKKDLTLTVCGVATEICLKHTVLDACELGFNTEVVIDACGALNLSPGDDVKAFREMTQKGAKLIEAREITESFKREPGREVGLSA